MEPVKKTQQKLELSNSESGGSPRWLVTELVAALLLELTPLLLHPPQAGHLGVQVPFSHQVLEVHDDLDGHVEDAQLRLQLVGLQVGRADCPELFESLVDVPDPDSLPRIVGTPPLALSLHPLLRRKTFVATLRQTAFPSPLHRCCARGGGEGLVKV